jgi:hypothetical protein
MATMDWNKLEKQLREAASIGTLPAKINGHSIQPINLRSELPARRSPNAVEIYYTDTIFVNGRPHKMHNGRRMDKKITSDLWEEMRAQGFPYNSIDYEITATKIEYNYRQSKMDGYVEGVDLYGVEFHDIPTGKVFAIGPARGKADAGYRMRERIIIIEPNEKMHLVYLIPEDEITERELSSPSFLHPTTRRGQIGEGYNFSPSPTEISSRSQPRRLDMPKPRTEDIEFETWKAKSMEWVANNKDMTPEVRTRLFNRVGWANNRKEASEVAEELAEYHRKMLSG